MNTGRGSVSVQSPVHIREESLQTIHKPDYSLFLLLPFNGPAPFSRVFTLKTVIQIVKKAHHVGILKEGVVILQILSFHEHEGVLGQEIPGELIIHFLHIVFYGLNLRCHALGKRNQCFRITFGYDKHGSGSGELLHDPIKFLHHGVILRHEIGHGSGESQLGRHEPKDHRHHQ